MNAIKELEKKSKRKVFIVDDHAVVREGLAQLINRENDLVVCGEASSVSDTLQHFSKCVPDIAIIDLTLKDGSGIRLVENLVYSWPGLMMIVLSMHDEFIYAERCLKAGASGYIMKNEPAVKIISALRKVLDGEIYVSESFGAAMLKNFAVNKIKHDNNSIGNLSNRELEVYQLIGQGLKKRDIAEELNLSVKTVENHIDHISKKLNLKGSYEVMLHAVKNSIGI